VIGLQAREDAFQILRILEIVTDKKARIGIRLHIFSEVEIVLQNVVDETTQKSNIAASADRGIDIGMLRGARKVGVNVNDGCTSLFSCHNPAEADGMAFCEIAALY
jgi:hypothetical protein